MDRYRVTLDYPDDRCAHGIVVQAADTEHAEQAAIESWETRKYTEAPGPVAFYRVSKVEKKERLGFGRTRWVTEATY
jgi:hypothetical protein